VRAPPIEVVLPSLLEFLGGAVLVGHNLRFDVSFLDAALLRSGRPRLSARTVDTCALARRLVRDEVPNCRLGTLADRFRLPHRPSHRALDDALATCDLLHALLERAAAFGVTGLDDLLALPKLGGHPQVAKLRLTATLPRSPGVYVFRDGGGRPLYVGKATDLRSRVRSYFSSDDRRKIGPMLRETQAIEHLACSSPLEAAVLEARLLHALLPRYNRQGTRWERAAYLRLDTSEAFPRLSVARSHRGRGLVLGPFPSGRTARLAAEAIETVVPLRRCTGRLRAGPHGTVDPSVRAAPCTPAQLGVALCPCAGGVTVERYAREVARVVHGLTRDPAALLDPLAERVATLAGAERYEEAADVRDRAAALALGLRRARRFDALRAAERVELELGDGTSIVLDRGVLRATAAPGALPGMAGGVGRGLVPEPDTPPPAGAALPAEAADELTAVASWLDRYAHRVRLVAVSGQWASALPALPTFRPARR
jgi:DNA polymerase-3 subunit epsilon